MGGPDEKPPQVTWYRVYVGGGNTTTHPAYIPKLPVGFHTVPRISNKVEVLRTTKFFEYANALKAAKQLKEGYSAFASVSATRAAIITGVFTIIWFVVFYWVRSWRGWTDSKFVYGLTVPLGM